MSNDLRWMLSSDQQFPYADPKMIELWFKVMKWFKPDVVDYLEIQMTKRVIVSIQKESLQNF